MFWGKEKKIQVELINPRMVLESRSPLPAHAEASPPATQHPSNENFSLDVSLKLAAVLAAVANACLLSFGYMRYLAMLELFGIQRAEVQFSIPDLLAYGYGAALNLVGSSRLAQIIFGVVIGLIALAFVTLAFKKDSGKKQMFLAWGLGIALSLAPAVPMVVGYYPARQSLLAVAAEQMGVVAEDVDGVKKRTEVRTSEGWMEGTILLTTGDFTYLLADSVVYKVRQADGVIVRRTHLSPKLKEAEPRS